jgi:crotonobetaine/carnitine-CoA ligase
MAVVVLEAGRDIDETELLDFCRPRLGPPALPRFVELVASMPRTAKGEIDRDALRRRGVTDATWERELRIRVPHRSAVRDDG